MKPMLHKLIIFTFLAAVSIAAFPAHACNVPVFRYALERWPSDSYTVIVFVGDALTQNDRDVIALLEKSSKASGGHANYTVQTVDVTGQMPEAIGALWNTMKVRELPCLTVLYPGFLRMKIPIWTGRLTAEAANRLIDSPARQEIARRILDGESAVWIFLEGGDRSRDDAAALTLKSRIEEASKMLELPVLDENGNDFVPIRETGPQLRVAFSMVRVSRNDPEESMLVNMLMKSEPDLEDYTSYPMAFPVYGRGRVLYALVGDGIDKRNVTESCSFVIGPCSCQIKELNPGVDLLMNVDWEGSFDRYVTLSSEIPPLVGLSELVGEAAKSADARETAVREISTTTAPKSPGDPGTGSQPEGDSGAAGEVSKKEPRISPDNGNAANVQTVSEDGHGRRSGHVVRNILAVLAFIAVTTVLSTLTVIKPWKRNKS